MFLNITDKRSHHHNLLWKTMEKLKKEMLCESRLGYRSQLHVGKVLTTHNTRPKTVPLIK